MKVRYGLMAMASAAAIAMTLATGAAPALANQTDSFRINNGSTNYYMVNVNVPNLPLEVLTGGGTLFSNIHGTTKSIDGSNPEPVYEWEQSGTTRCWTYEANDSGYLVEQNCVAGDTTQLFWQTTSGQFINVAASNETGTHFCVNATHAVDGDPINVIACKSRSQPGGFDQYWSS